jgi:hypothetical protein
MAIPFLEVEMTAGGFRMSEEHYPIQRLLKLRKLTRAIADLLRGQLIDYLATLRPMFLPRSIFGEYVQGGAKESVRGAEKVYLQLQSLYASVAKAKPYNLEQELRSPINLENSALEITPVEYSHIVTSDGQSKAVAVTSPFKWVLTYTGFSPARLQQLLANPNRIDEETHRFVLHYTALRVALASHPGLPRLFEGLRFPIGSGRMPEFGELPLTYISSRISSIRPPDELIVESTEISGQNAFEEIVNLDDLRNLEDPIHTQLLELARSHGELIVAEG